MDKDPLSLGEYETTIVVRRATNDDIPAIIDLGLRCFPGMHPWKPEQLAEHQKIFPEGQVVCFVEGKLAGSSSCLIVELDEFSRQHTFKEITGEGWLTTHDEEGEDLYGMEVMVDPAFRGMKIGERLYEVRQEIALVRNLRRIVIAGRMPGLAAAPEVTPSEYLKEVRSGKRLDPVLNFQMGQGFMPKQVIQNYLPLDAESRGCAVLLEWANIDFQTGKRKRMRSSQTVRVCVIQYGMRKITSFEEFAQQTAYFVDVAANYKSDFAVFPELLTTQLLSSIPEKDPRKSVTELTSYTEAYLEHFQALSVRYNVNILAGTHLVAKDGLTYNVAFLFKRDGTIEEQYKLHMTPNEKRWWNLSPGEELNIINTDVGKIAINICYDVEFPELARLATLKGAKILFVPYCTEDRQGHLRVKYCAQARAVENQIYVVTAGTVGNLPDSENMDVQYAQSGVFTPSDFSFPRDGIAGEATANVETVVVTDLDLEVLRRARKDGSVVQLRDRRNDLYEVIEKKAKPAKA